MTTQYTPQFLPANKPVQPISILGENGKLRKGASTTLDDDTVFRALRMMMLARTFDVKCLSLQRQGKLGTFAPVFGQEATTLGVALALDPKRDWLVPQYRELPAMVWHGHPLLNTVLYRLGHPEGSRNKEGVRVVGNQVSLAAQLPHAVGLAWGYKLRGEPAAVAVFFGDGASSEGDFHESCNLAGTVNAPVLFVLQNNNWAISTPRAIQSATVDLASRGPGYGFPGVSVDGNDLFAMHRVAADAVERGLAGEGPTLIEAHTYRMGAHTTADDPTRYVDSEELEGWKRRDPIARVQKYLAARDRWDEEIAAATEAEITAEIDATFEEAAATPPPPPEAIFDHIFAEPTPTLARQRAAFRNGG
jgi:pyruvate dehydrogenase E1 component alpha subunit